VCSSDLWTKVAIRILIQGYRTQESGKDIADKLGCTSKAVHNMAFALDLCKKINKSTMQKGKPYPLTKQRLYKIYNGMKSRCYHKTNGVYKYYGGKGIKVDDAWRESFDAFSDWAMKNGYQQNLFLCRKDTTGDYTPSNCKWDSSRRTKPRHIQLKI
jgi:hypothetical protein